MTDTFEHLFNTCCRTAPFVFTHNGYHTGIMFVGRNSIVDGPIHMAWKDDAEKERLYAHLRFKYQSKMNWYIHVAEAWVIDKPLDDVIGSLQPTLNPERQECLIVVGIHRDGRRVSSRWWIIRDNSGNPRLDLQERITEIPWSLLDEVILGISKPPLVKVNDRRQDDLGVILVSSPDLTKQQERHFQQWCPRCQRTTVHSELSILQPGSKVYISTICLNCNMQVQSGTLGSIRRRATEWLKRKDRK